MLDILLFGSGWNGDTWQVEQADLEKGMLDLHEYPQMRPLADPDVSQWPLPIQFCIDRYTVYGEIYLIGYAGVKPPERDIMRAIVQANSKPAEY